MLHLKRCTRYYAGRAERGDNEAGGDQALADFHPPILTILPHGV